VLNIHLRLSLPWVGLPGATEGCRGECPTVALLGFMVHILAEKPSVFAELPDTVSDYYGLADDIGYYAYACLDFSYPPIAMVHLEMKRFSHNILNLIKAEDWPACVKICKEHGCSSIVASTEGSKKSNAKWIKFVRNFGFTEFRDYTASNQSIGE
jgi:hypothetical protein